MNRSFHLPLNWLMVRAEDECSISQPVNRSYRTELRRPGPHRGAVSTATAGLTFRSSGLRRTGAVLNRTRAGRKFRHATLPYRFEIDHGALPAWLESAHRKHPSKPMG